MLALGQEFSPKLPQVVVEDDREGVRAVAVHVNQGVEMPLGAGEEPIDGALLVAFDVVRVEVLEEVATDVLAQRSLDEGQVLLVMRLAEGDPQEFLETFGDVVGEPVLGQDGDDVFFVRHKGDAVDGRWLVGGGIVSCGGA